MRLSLLLLGLFVGNYSVFAGESLNLSIDMSWPDSHRPALHQQKPVSKLKNVRRVEVSENPLTGHHEFVNRLYSVDGNVINEFYTGYVVRE